MSARTADRALNLGLATRLDPLLVDGTTAVFSVSEFDQGSRDLNRDGEVAGSVVHVFDALTGEVRNLGLENGNVQSFGNGRLLTIVASESDDLNGDGDNTDALLYVYDTARRALTNLRLAPPFNDTGGLLFDGRRLIFGVDESFQGRDLNKDGDLVDVVLHLFDSVTGRVQNTGLAGSLVGKGTVGFAGRWIAVRVTESRAFGTSGQSRDLNGDGDTTDAVLHLFDTVSGRVTNLGVALADSAFNSGFRSSNGQGLVAVSEAGQGVDLNSDRDLTDMVLHSVDLSSGRVRSTGIAIVSSGTKFFPDVLDFMVQEGFAVFNREESDARQDLNGDGDQNDIALQVLTTRSGRLRSLKVRAALLPAEAQPGRALLLMDEAVIGKDLNGDGDAGSDLVLGLVDLSSNEPRVVSTGRAIASASNGEDVLSWPPFPIDPFPLQLRDNLATFVVSEAAEAARDLNGDGDANDFLLHISDLSTLTTLNTGLSGSFAYRTVQAALLRPNDARVVLPVREDRQGRDLNRDGDMQDMVLQVIDVRSGRSRNTGFAIATVPSLTSMPNSELFAFPYELPLLTRGQGFQSALVREAGVDLNSDGDTRDLVLHLFDVASGTITNTGLASGTPEDDELFDIGFGFAGFSPGLSLITLFTAFGFGQPSSDGPGLGDAYAFIVSEAAQGNVDLNGDGDTDDLVVHATRLSDRDRNGRFDFTQ